MPSLCRHSAATRAVRQGKCENTGGGSGEGVGGAGVAEIAELDPRYVSFS